jgi:hypothetical protein
VPTTPFPHSRELQRAQDSATLARMLRDFLLPLRQRVFRGGRGMGGNQSVLAIGMGLLTGAAILLLGLLLARPSSGISKADCDILFSEFMHSDDPTIVVRNAHLMSEFRCDVRKGYLAQTDQQRPLALKAMLFAGKGQAAGRGDHSDA